MLRTILLGVIACFSFTISVAAQESSVEVPTADSANAQPNSANETPEPALTEDETRQAKSIADEFTRRMLDGEDAGGVVDDLFVADFMERFQNAQQKCLLGDEGRPEETELFLMNHELWKTADPGALRRYYLSMASMMSSLSAVTLADHGKSNDDEDENDDPWQKFVVPSLKTIAENDEFAANMLADNEDDKYVENMAELEKVTRTFSRLSEQLRKDYPGTDSAAISETDAARKWTKDPDNDPQLEIYDRDAFGYPAGTRFITVNTMTGMFLILASENGTLKIVWADIVDD